MSSKSYDEKRNFIRMKVETPVSVALESSNAVFDGTCIDLSGGGLLVKLNQALELNSELEVKIASEHGHNPMLVARTTVTRVAKIIDDEYSHEIGLRIEEMLTQ